MQKLLEVDLENYPQAQVDGAPLLPWILGEIQRKSRNHYAKLNIRSLLPLSDEDIIWTPYTQMQCPRPLDLDCVRDIVPVFYYNFVEHHMPHLCHKQFEKFKSYDVESVTWQYYEISFKQRKGGTRQKYSKLHEQQLKEWNSRQAAETYMIAREQEDMEGEQEDRDGFFEDRDGFFEGRNDNGENNEEEEENGENHEEEEEPCGSDQPKRHRGAVTPLPEYPIAAPIATKQVNFWASSLTGPKDWVFCGSALSSEEKCYLAKFASTCGATISRSWNPNVTHVIASTDANGVYTRTLKVLMAILHGRWVVTMDWIKACKEMNKPEDEEKYEAGLDNHGCWGGPKSGRLRGLQNAPKLFSGINFYFSGDFLPAYKDDLLNLVTTAGGFVIKNKEQLAALSSPAQGSSITLVVYNVDRLHYTLGNEESVLLQRLRTAEDLATELLRLRTAKDLATEYGCRVLKHTWILESIAACTLQPYC